MGNACAQGLPGASFYEGPGWALLSHVFHKKDIGPAVFIVTVGVSGIGVVLFPSRRAVHAAPINAAPPFYDQVSSNVNTATVLFRPVIGEGVAVDGGHLYTV